MKIQRHIPAGILALISLFSSSHKSFASEPGTEGRIDVIGAGSVEIDVGGEGVKIERATWEGTQPEKHAVVSFVASEEWRETSITITPSQSGKVLIFLMGPQPKPAISTGELAPVRICYDKIESDAGVDAINNGSFEFGSENWKRVDLDSSTLPVNEDNAARVENGNAADGSNFASVWHNSRLSQPITVHAGEPVTIKFSYRLAAP